MKKLYITFVTLLVIGVSAGVYYFTGYKQGQMHFPEEIVMETVKGEKYSFKEMPPKVRLLEFIYLECPDICPNTTLQMKNIRDRLVEDGLFGDKVEFLTVTFNPAQDTIEKLKQYDKTFGMSETTGWELLRGSREDTKKLTDSFEFLFRDSGTKEFVHSSTTYLINEKNRVVKRFGMGEYDFDQDEVYKAIIKQIKN